MDKHFERTNRVAPSATPYLFHYGDREINYRVGNEVFSVDLPAIWLGRKNGMTTVTRGSFNVFPDRMDGVIAPDASLDDLTSVADLRYGGKWFWKFDGEHLLVEPTWALTLDEQREEMDFLGAILRDPKTIPEGWDGWFRAVS